MEKPADKFQVITETSYEPLDSFVAAQMLLVRNGRLVEIQRCFEEGSCSVQIDVKASAVDKLKPVEGWEIEHDGLAGIFFNPENAEDFIPVAIIPDEEWEDF